ncbi:chemotaxis protein CheW [Nocardioides sp. GY 10127]|uniref:chemotaxis protein CheW n=1 Tax=Nocardioides sp. GY 10127 TaxID=2569762 RepID=UPI0010A939F2|nr:chemotaxis protein CheW [Nocardioides sp. GY 10127]TIC79018.1 chemotaxis protein CheW [Nocardioides sp. GY 10127]
MSQFCTFTVGGHLFGVPVESVQEVLRAQEVTRVPLAPREVSGLLNLRGQIVTSIDLRRRLGMVDRDADGKTVNIVVRTADGSAVSLVADEIGDVLEPPADSFETPPETVPAAVRAVVERVCKLEKRLMLLLDTHRAIGGLDAA